MTDQFLQVTPFMHVADLDATVAFFTDLLGFDVPFRMPGYAYVEREGSRETAARSQAAGAK